ncbi:MAG: helix-turn-helix transcriptional regulator [Thermoleophilia bacterium]|nr:helix-turn-helix transcriptional regulator [Thermoleophilia bacterium]
MVVEERADLVIRATVAAGLRRARERTGRTQAQVAAALYCTVSAWRHYERGRHPVLVERLPAIAAAIGCTLEQLLADCGLLVEPESKVTRVS